MDYRQRIPTAPPLAGAVELCFLLTGYTPPHRLERLVPTGRMNLVIELDGRERHVFDNETGAPRQRCVEAWLSGVHAGYLTIGETLPASRLAVAQFAPGGARCLLPDDLFHYEDRVVPAVDVFGPSVLELRTALLATEDPEAGLDRLEAWLAARHDPAQAAPAIVQAAIERLLDAPGEVVLTSFVDAHGGTSYKHFVELFRKHVGPTPKRMQRILRFAQVFARIEGASRVDWAGLAAELGYADQAHFVREFRAFSGYRPRDFIAKGFDRPNFFPDDPDA